MELQRPDSSVDKLAISDKSVFVVKTEDVIKVLLWTGKFTRISW